MCGEGGRERSVGLGGGGRGVRGWVVVGWKEVEEWRMGLEGTKGMGKWKGLEGRGEEKKLVKGKNV